MGPLARLVPPVVKRGVRRAARRAARVRHTRAWPLVRPAVRLARRVADLDRILGRPPGAWDRPRAELQIELVRRRLLNLGLTDRALVDLRELAADESWPHRQRRASWELALWYADRYRELDASRSLEYLRLARRGEEDPTRRRQLAVVEAECHQRAGNLAAAHLAVTRALVGGPDPDLYLAAANLEPVLARRVAWLNRALAHHGLAGIELADPVTGPAFDHLRSSAAADPGTGPRVEGPTVTVIMPVHNSAGVVGTALSSVLAQTWPHLEVLVVDDASTDETAAVVVGYAARDQRVRLIRVRENRGTYVARNLALREATGHLVTCHDADDWSHPEKLERQVRHLIGNPSVVASTSAQVRATADLTFHRRGKPGYFVFPNLSSLMFRRAPVMEELGYWDCVRFGADAELQRRIRLVFGRPALVDLATGPLSLQRQSVDSLTGSESFGYHGYFMGARKDYFESYTDHHRTAGSLRYEFPHPTRPFPVPEPMRPDRAPRPGRRRHVDVAIASDFRLVGGSTVSSLEEVKAQRRLGLRTGLVQMSHYPADPRRRVATKVRELVDGDRVQMLVHGERVSCDLLIVRYPPVLQEWHRFLPDLAPAAVRVVVNQPPMSHYGPDAEVRYRIGRCHEHLERYFGQPGVWHPIGPLVRDALYRHHADELAVIDLSDEDWINIIDIDRWRRPGRPARGARPRIGRHSRDHPLKWPATAGELLAIYPDSPDYEVHVLGGGKAPEAVLGHLPDNWRVLEFGQCTPREFLAGIDVFVYYPNPHWVESFGRVILEAMAAGVPVVLPDRFQPLFGEAAVYATPAGVRAAVDALMADDHYYASRADAAQRFVRRGFGYGRHKERIRGLLSR